MAPSVLGRGPGDPRWSGFIHRQGFASCNKSHHRHKAGGKVSPHLFWPWGRREVGGLQGQNCPPPPWVDAEGSGLLGCFTSCDFPPPSAFRAAPQGSSTGGHVADAILVCWGTEGRGVPVCMSPGQGRWQAPAQSPECWYGGYWGLVHGLLGAGIGAGMGVAGNGYGGYWGLIQGVLGSSSLAEQLQVHGFGSLWAGFGGRSGV